MEDETGDAREPLNPQEDARLRRWQRWMIRSFVVSMILFIIVMISPMGETVRFILWICAVTLVVVSAGLQFSRRCPRCGANIGTQTRLTLPAACKRCGVRLRR